MRFTNFGKFDWKGERTSNLAHDLKIELFKIEIVNIVIRVTVDTAFTSQCPFYLATHCFESSTRRPCIFVL